MTQDNPTSKIKLNVNALVSFELTDEGLKYYLAEDNRLLNIKIDNETRKITTELWVAMRLFGKHLRMGQSALIVDNIFEIDTKELTNE